MKKDIADLIQEAESFLILGETIQGEGLSIEDRTKNLEELDALYHKWYRSALKYFDHQSNLNNKHKFEHEYEGTTWTAKISKFLSSGLMLNPFFVTDNQLGIDRWTFQYKLCFKEPLKKQCNILSSLEFIDRTSTIQGGAEWNKTIGRILKVFIEKAENAKTNNEKKFTYEYLAMFVVASIEGLTIIGHDERGACDEVDLWVSNASSDTFWKNQIGDPFIVECKNWEKPVGSPEIRTLRSIMEDKNIRFSLLLSKCGVTGSGDREAEGLIQKAFKDGKYIVVLNQPDLLEIANGIHPADMIKKKLYHLFIYS